jgi:hypothetical protein
MAVARVPRLRKGRTAAAASMEPGTPGPKVFAILLTPGQKQPMVVLQAIFESGIRKVEITMAIEMPSMQSPPCLANGVHAAQLRAASERAVSSCDSRG